MSAILCGTDLAGLALRALAPLAEGISSAGFRAILVARAPVDAGAHLPRDGARVLQAPSWPDPASLPAAQFRPRSAAEVLAAQGWADPDVLQAMVGAWDAILDRVRPAAVLVSHAPSLALATWGRHPVLQVAAGIELPPAHLPRLPSLDLGAPATEADEAVLESVAVVQSRLGRREPESLGQVLGHGARLLADFAELDPYAADRRDTEIGPLPGPPDPPAPPRPGWLAVLEDRRGGVEPLLRSLADTGIAGEVHVPAAGAALRRALEGIGLRVLDSLPPLEAALGRASVVIHGGDMRLAGAALAAGRPQLVLPLRLEERVTADRLSRLGVAVSAAPGEDAGAALRRLTRGTLFASEAVERAAAIRKRGPWGAVGRVAEAIRQVAPGSGRP